VYTQGERAPVSKPGFDKRFTPQVGELVMVELIVVVVVEKTVRVVVTSMVEVVCAVLTISTELIIVQLSSWK
jgi:hypothetical protein